MSLNGLDEAKVAEAHQAALTEAGGWFLLKYSTRDTVELLSRGSGGVAEVRSAIIKYEEKSPLYGLVQFRRKKIILKYVPDGTSRLLQVRLTVQFQSILETFVPHDTVLSLAAPSELTEAALTSACMLHPSPMSLTSSSSSLPRQPLGEISEDAEESPHVRGQSKSKVAVLPVPPPPPPADFAKEEKEKPASIAASEPVVGKSQPLLTRDHQQFTPPVLENEGNAVRSPPLPLSRATTATPTRTIVPTTEKSLPTTPEHTPPNTSDGKITILPTALEAPILPSVQQLSNAYRVEEIDPRVSIQSARPSVIDTGRPSFSNYDSYDPYKPKVRRGPRPHVEPETRPQTAGSAKKPQTQRLVANLPTSVRTQNRSVGVSSGRPNSQQSSRSVPSRFVHYSEQPAVPPLPSSNHISSLFLPQSQHDRPYSRADSVTSTATAAATPEKLRLMKALQLRKRTQQQARRESEKPKPLEETKVDIRSQIEADLESIRSQSRAGGSNSTSASRIEEAAKAIEAARIASPTSMTNNSEVPSTQSSSFVEDNDGTASHASISSDTSSSVTPKANARKAQQRKQTESSVPIPTLAAANPAAVQAQEASTLVEDRPVGFDTIKAIPGPEVECPAESVLDTVMPSYQHSVLPDEQTFGKDTAGPIEDNQSVVNTAILAPESDIIDDGVRPPVPSKSDDGQIRRKRGAVLETMKIPSSPDPSEASDDDSFMEELQHAQVQQAKPIAVGRSPVTPIYHNLSSSTDRLKDVSHTVSSPLNDTTNSGPNSPDQSRPRSVRSISTALPSWPPSNENIPPVPLARKGPLSSGISKRIKALEVFTSGRESSSTPPPLSPNNTPTQKSKAALPTSRKRLSFMPRGNAPNTSTTDPPPSLLSTSAQTPESELTAYEQSQPMYQRRSSAVDIFQPSEKGETISVTARIVRNPNTIYEDSTVAADDLQQMPLQRSKVTIEHERSDHQNQRPPMARDASSFSAESPAKALQTERARPSFSSYRSDSQTRLPTSDSMMSRFPMTSGKKKEKASFARSNSDNSSFNEEKSKQSRARRLMQRVSNLSTNSRRTITSAFSTGAKDQVASDTITERAESIHDLASVAESVSHVVDIGDVNVQFPDTLLWKRRFLRIDDQGYLIFSPPTMERNTRNISRKVHLSEFKKPTLPDVEREEMAWSVLLDMEDGSCIQCACESKYTQTQVLRMLVDAHSAYHLLYSA